MTIVRPPTVARSALLLGLFLLGIAIGSLVHVVPADAARRKPKITLVRPSDTFSITISFRQGRKTVSEDLHCYKKQPGRLVRNKRGMAFNSLASQLKKLREARKQNTAKYKRLAKVSKLATKQCRNPTFLSLTPYKGTFGEREARMLFARFALGGSEAQVQRAVQIGLAATVNELTTYQPDPTIDAQFQDVMCDTYFATDPWNGEADTRNEACNRFNPNDLSRSGTRKALQWRFAYGNNPFFDRLFFFIQDERLAVNFSVLDGEEYHALRTYVDMVDRAARSGDYKQYMREANTDHFLALNWLDGSSNRGYNPNENFAREFWELGTVGAADLDGNPNYSAFDIAQAALAHSGWTFVRERRAIQGEDEDRWYKYASRTPAFHAPGQKTIFSGTRYQTIVYDADDILEATFRHPRTAESLAEDICRQFLNPDCPAPLVKELAKTIRAENYNLLPAFRRVMRSQALFAAGNRMSVIKHPIELLIGFIRQTGVRLTLDEIDSLLSRLEQRPLEANTVFGWDELVLAGESYVLAWRNVVLDIVNHVGQERLLEERGFDLHARFLSDSPSSQVALDRVASALNVTLNANQKNLLDQYLNFYQTTCRSWDVNQYGCEEGELFLKRDQFDSFRQGNWDSKIRALMGILLMLPEYRMK